MSYINAKRNNWDGLEKFNSFKDYALLSVLGLLMAFVMVRLTYKFDLLLVIGAFSAIIACVCLFDPSVGYYATIIIGFLFFWIQRMIGKDLPLGVVIDGLCYIAFFSIMIHNLVARRQHWFEWHVITYLMLLSIALKTIELFNPEANAWAWLQSYRRTVSVTLLFFTVLYIFNDIKRIRFFFKLLLGLSLLAALYGCWQEWVGFLPFEKRWLFSDLRRARLYTLNGAFRKFSILSDPANFGTLMASMGVCAFILATGPFPKRKRVILFIAGFFMIISVGFSGTRTGYVMVPAGIFLYALMTIYQKRTQLLMMGFGVVFAFILLVPYNGSDTLNRIRSAFSPHEDPSFQVRVYHRGIIQPYIHNHPIGGGLATSGAAGLQYSPHHFLAGFPSDSAYLLTAMETGWVGLAIFCLFFLVTMRYGVYYFYRVRSQEIKVYYAAIVSFLFTLSLANYAQIVIGQIPQVVLFPTFLALTIKLHKFDS